MINYCISHRPLLFKNNKEMRHILLGDEIIRHTDAFTPSTVVNHVSDISTQLDFWHVALGGSSGTFAIAAILLHDANSWSDTDSICINQYRKFISRSNFGTQSANYPGMYMVPEDIAADIDVYEHQSDVSTPFLIANPINVGNLYTQYCVSHHGQDLLRYMAIAVDLGYIEHAEVGTMMNSDTLIPGGVEFGVYPVSVFLSIASKLQDICMGFLNSTSPTNKNRYQRRALSFCNERMGSYLLMKVFNQIGAANIPKEWFGTIQTISNETRYFGSV